MKLFRKKQSWWWFGLKFLIVMSIVGSVAVFGSRYRFDYDPQTVKCLPGYSFFLVDTKDKALVRGHIYAFHSDKLKPFFSNSDHMAKVLVGLPGDQVQINAKGIFVNGACVGHGLTYADIHGRTPQQLYGKTTLKPNQYWFMGKSDQSFDSRYWGTVSNEQIIGRVYPLF